MAVAFVQNHTVGSSNTSDAVVVATIATTDVAVGNLLVAWVSFNNNSATTPNVSSISTMAGETNSWVKIVEHDASNTSATAAVRGELWGITTTVAWTTGTSVTATLTDVNARKTILLQEFSGVGTLIRGTAGTGTSTTNTPTASTSGTALVAGDLVIGAASFETGTAGSDDTDTTNGSWSAGLTHYAGTTSASTSNIRSIMQYKIITATGVQTYNPIGGSSSYSGAVVVALRTQSPPTAPTGLTVTGSPAANGSPITLSWTHNDPDGDPQTKFKIRWRKI